MDDLPEDFCKDVWKSIHTKNFSGFPARITVSQINLTKLSILGTRTRTLKTVDGVLQLNKPQVREFPFETKVFERYSRVEKAMDSVILESYINGVSTRNVRNVVAALGLENVSASYVSSLSSELDVKVKQFLERKIDEPVKFIYIDATYFKVREYGIYRNKALYICTGINGEGKYYLPYYMIQRVRLTGDYSLMI